MKCFLCLYLTFVASLHLPGAVKKFHHILHSWENVVDYKYTCNSWSILSILRLLKRGVFWVLINRSWKRILENGLNCHPMPPYVVNVSWMWLVMPGIQSIAKYPECIVMLSTWGWGPQLFRIFLAVHQHITPDFELGSTGALLCVEVGIKTGRSAWNHNPETFRSVSCIEKCIHESIHYLLYADRWCIRSSVPPRRPVLSIHKIFWCVLILAGG